MRKLHIACPLIITLFCYWHIIMKPPKPFSWHSSCHILFTSLCSFSRHQEICWWSSQLSTVPLPTFLLTLVICLNRSLTESSITQNTVCKNFSYSSLWFYFFLFVCLFQIQVLHILASSKLFALWIPFGIPICTLQVIHNDDNLNPRCALICTRHPSDMQELSWMPVLTFVFYFLMKFNAPKAAGNRREQHWIIFKR